VLKVSRPYVAERQVEYWTSRQIEDYYLDGGFECLTYPLTQKVEYFVPADFVFRAGSLMKVFGLQYKALYPGSVDNWILESRQHGQMAQFPWIYYGLSGLKQRSQFRNALHALRVKERPSAFSTPLLETLSSPYMRWWAFDQQLQSCSAGIRITSRDDFLSRFAAVWDSPLAREDAGNMADVFVVNFDNRQLLHLSPLLHARNEGVGEDDLQ
jgi:hypothetical protein